MRYVVVAIVSAAVMMMSACGSTPPSPYTYNQMMKAQTACDLTPIHYDSMKACLIEKLPKLSDEQVERINSLMRSEKQYEAQND